MMHHSTFLLAVALLSVSANAGNFQGTPQGGQKQGKILDFPQCAKSCIKTPPSNFVNEFPAFCKAVPNQNCCIIKACKHADVDVTHQIASQICGYIGQSVAAFTCKPTKKVTSTLATSKKHSTSSTHSTSTKHSTSSTHTTSTPHPTSTKHSSSTPSTLHTSTRSTSTSHTSTKPASTPSTTKTTSKATSSTPVSVAGTAPLSSLGVYDGYVGASCYSEGTTGPALNGPSFTSANMTIQNCLDQCKKGWGWAGMENGNTCYCGDGMHNGGAPTSTSACNMPCSGDKTQNCGGKGALSVYQSG